MKTQSGEVNLTTWEAAASCVYLICLYERGSSVVPLLASKAVTYNTKLRFLAFTKLTLKKRRKKSTTNIIWTFGFCANLKFPVPG
jgi:acetamidase/formamidase